eukprot:7544311-Alexandrium_andersonii.AAC.1
MCIRDRPPPLGHEGLASGQGGPEHRGPPQPRQPHAEHDRGQGQGLARPERAGLLDDGPRGFVRLHAARLAGLQPGPEHIR